MLAMGSVEAVLVVANAAASLTLSGILSNGAGVLALTQSGAGTTTLTGYESYTGATNVTGGTLQIGNGTTGSLGATAVTVSGTGAPDYKPTNKFNPGGEHQSQWSDHHADRDSVGNQYAFRSHQWHGCSQSQWLGDDDHHEQRYLYGSDQCQCGHSVPLRLGLHRRGKHGECRHQRHADGKWLHSWQCHAHR